MKFTLFVLIASFISVNSTPLVNLTKDQILKLTPRSLPFINQKIVTSLKKMHESISILNRISSGRKPCIWKICSKPVIIIMIVLNITTLFVRIYELVK